MCCIFKISHSNRINRRKRKILALLSLTSGLTMLVIVQFHHVSIIHRVGSDLLPLSPPTTNDTPVDYFLPGEEERGTEVPIPFRSLNNKEYNQISPRTFPVGAPKKKNGPKRKIPVGPFSRYQFSNKRSREQLTDFSQSNVTLETLDNIGEQEIEVEISTEDTLRCCDDDFHQNPYLVEDSLKDLTKSRDQFSTKKHIKHISGRGPISSNNEAKRSDFSNSFVPKLKSFRELVSEIPNESSHRNFEYKAEHFHNNNNNAKEISEKKHENKSKDNNKYQTKKHIRKEVLRAVDKNKNSNVVTKNNLENRKDNFKLQATVNFNTKNLESGSRLTSRKPILTDADEVERKPSGNTIININIENFVNNLPFKYFGSLKNKTFAPELIQEIDKFRRNLVDQSLLRKNEDKKDIHKIKPNSSSYAKDNSSNNDIIIPEVTVSNISYADLKEKSLKHILDKFDLSKMFQNVSYRNTILSRDLSQWSEFLSLPEEDPGNTYEPNNIIDASYYEKKHLETTRKKEDNWKQGIREDKSMSSSFKRLENVKVPNSLKEIQRHKIRDTFIPLQETFLDWKNGNKKSSGLSGREYFNIQTDDRKAKKENETQGGEWNGGQKGNAPDVLFPYFLDYTRPAYFPWRLTKDECSLYATRFLVGGTGKIAPLASFPGSGNTWLRYISEVLTGIFTGALYEDDILATEGFWGERDSYVEGTSLLQKTHSFPALPEEVFEWDGRIILGPAPRKVVLLMRSPYEALVSLRHFHAAGHTGFGRHSAFSGLGWDNFTEVRAISWLQLNEAWLQLPKTKVLVIHYEMLMQNLEYESKRLLNFLGIPIDYGRLTCLLRYPEGKFRRPRYPKHLQGYKISQKSASTIASAITILNQVLAKNGHPTLPTHLYSFHPPTWPPRTRIGETSSTSSKVVTL